MLPLILAGIAAAQAIDQSQRAKNQQEAEIAKMRFSPWTGMQGGVVPLPNAPIMEAVGGGIKGMEYVDAQKDADMQRQYLAKRIDNLDNRDTANTWQAMDRVLGVKPTGGK